MNILIDINHPGQVHLFRNTYYILKNKGHNVWVTIKDIPMGIRLLELYGINYTFLGSKSDSILGKAINQVKYNFKLTRLFIKNNIDIAIGSSISVDHASVLTKTKSLHFSDDDPDVVPFVVKYAHPFTNTILCPDCLSFPKHEFKTIKYSGYHELAYLHPDRFQPDPTVLNEIGLKLGDPFFIMRFNVFKAHHDIGINGLSLEQKLDLIELLKPHGKIFITTERDIEPELKPYQMPVSPEKAHSLLSFATLFLGDSQTMTSEAAVLGVPSLRCNSFAGRISYLEEEEHRYGLTYGFLPSEFDKFLEKLKKLLDTPDLKKIWQQKRERMLSDKIDATSFFCWFIENYPKSFEIMAKNPDYQHRFK